MKLVTAIKSAALSDRATPSTIRVGLYRGIKMMLRPVDSQQLRFGLQERETHGYIRSAAVRCAWLIDVGADPGELSLFFSLKTDADKIVAIDPNLNLLLTNVALNNATRIEPLKRRGGTQAGCIALDDIAVDRKKTGFVRIDVEGSELDILRSGDAVLKDARPLLLIETHSADLERECIAHLAARSYQVKIIPNAWWRAVVPERRPREQNRWLWAEPL